MSRSLKLLGIETSTLRCGVALGQSEQRVDSAVIGEGARATTMLVSTIRKLCCAAQLPPRELDLICVNIGPGSYTGLRVGLTCAKTLAFAAASALAPVESLSVVAENITGGELLEVAFDAARGQVFAGQFERQAGRWHRRGEIKIVAAEVWGRQLTKNSLVAGPALAKYRDLISIPCTIVDEPFWWPKAEHVLRLGLQQHLKNPVRDFWTLEPLYLRPSAAEEKQRGIADENGR